MTTGMTWLRDSSHEIVLSGLSYAVSSTCLTLVNKYVFSRRQFHFPWFTLAIQNLISVFLILFLSFTPFLPKLHWRRKLTKELRVPITFFVLFIFSNAQALRYMNLPVLTVFKSLGPMGITLFERLFFKDKFSIQVYCSMFLIILSTFITAIYDLEYTTLGYFWALTNVAANIGYLASLRYYVSNKFTSLEKTFHSNLLALIPIIPISIATKEFPQVIYAVQQVTGGFVAAFSCSGVLTLGICASAFWCITCSNGSTLSFIGGFNKVPIVVLGAILFETKTSVPGWIGVVLGLVAGLLFIKSKSASKVEKSDEMKKEKELDNINNSSIDLSGVNESNGSLGPQLSERLEKSGRAKSAIW